MVSTMSHHMMLSQGWPALTHSLAHSAPTLRSSHSGSPWNAGILLDVPSTPTALTHGAWRPRASPRAGSPARRRDRDCAPSPNPSSAPQARRRAPPPPPQHHQQQHHHQQQSSPRLQAIPPAFPEDGPNENQFSLLMSPAPQSVTGYAPQPAHRERRRITSYTQSPAPGGGFTYALHTAPVPSPTPNHSSPTPTPSPPVRAHPRTAPAYGYAPSPAPSRAAEYALARQRQRAAAEKEARLKVIASILLNRVNVVGKPMRRRSADLGRAYVKSGLGREITA
ncbi:hypothetical protein HWV62_35542 [Athelia sp. TMB]|nr:hypothetical protein HWV62_35542 [Athelia sp. TMB]